MNAFHLYRFEQSNRATYGLLRDTAGNKVATTLELPDRGNQHDISRIPAGEYTAVRFHSPKRGYEVWLLENVPGREAIEIHAGNTAADTDGCILIGTTFGELRGIAVLGSKPALADFMDKTHAENRITLTITDPT